MLRKALSELAFVTIARGYAMCIGFVTPNLIKISLIAQLDGVKASRAREVEFKASLMRRSSESKIRSGSVKCDGTAFFIIAYSIGGQFNSAQVNAVHL